MHIVRCDDSHAAAWNEYVRAAPSASFYHRAEWRELNRRSFGHDSAYLAAIEEGRIVGIFPMVRVTSLVFGKIACSMPFVNYGGPCGDSPEIERRLIDEATRVAEEWDVEYVEIRSQRDLGADLPCSDHKVSMTVDLDADPEKIWAGFKTGQRKEVQRAYKHGFTARFGAELVDDFYEVLSESWRDLGTPLYRASYLKDVLAAFPQETRVCVVYAADGTAAAGAFDGIHEGTVEGMWLGMRAEYRKQLVGYVLYWELIKRACEEGFTRFHLGRSSKDSGAEAFKKKWNARTDQLYWHYILRRRTAIPALNHANPRYALAIQAWRKMPVPVTRWLGPWFAKGIP